jgi:hypothetical protein
MFEIPWETETYMGRLILKWILEELVVKIVNWIEVSLDKVK